MTRRLIIIAFMLMGTALCAVAQNSIDDLVERYSARGQTKFTSAVDRDPKTRKVRKVVKVLEIYDSGTSKFVEAFRKESLSGPNTTTYIGDTFSKMFTTSNSRQNRIYKLECKDPYQPGRQNTQYGYAKITVIVKYK